MLKCSENFSVLASAVLRVLKNFHGLKISKESLCFVVWNLK